MTLFTDGFTGSDGTTINGRSGWTKIGSGATDTPMLNGSGAIKTGGVDPSDSAVYGQDVGNADHFIQINWSANANESPGSFQGICVRVTDRNEHVGAYYDGSVWRIYSPGEGSFGSNAGPGAPTSSTVVRLTAQGTTYKLFVDDMDTEIISVTYSDVAIDTPTKVGIMARSTAAENPFMTGPYYSGLLADIADIPSGDGGGGGFAKLIGPRFKLAGHGGGLVA